MDTLELIAVRNMQKHFTGLLVPCPSKYCDGFLTEFEQVSLEPFKAFLMCPKCESRLRVFKKDKGWLEHERPIALGERF